MIDLNRTDGRCVVIRTASGETVAVAPGEAPRRRRGSNPGELSPPVVALVEPRCSGAAAKDPGDWTPLEDEE
jgi:hypothetical protein